MTETNEFLALQKQCKANEKVSYVNGAWCIVSKPELELKIEALPWGKV